MANGFINRRLQEIFGHVRGGNTVVDLGDAPVLQEILRQPTSSRVFQQAHKLNIPNEGLRQAFMEDLQRRLRGESVQSINRFLPGGDPRARGGGGGGGGSGSGGGGGGGDNTPSISAPTTTDDFLSTVFQSRPALVAQQADILRRVGPSARDAVFSAIPELAESASFLSERVSQGAPESVQQDLREQVRTAQAARGFGGGGTGPAGQEARFVTALNERSRLQASQQLAQLGFGISQLGGLSPPGDINVGTIGGLQISQRRLQEETAAGRRQSQFAQDQFNRLFPLLSQSLNPAPNQQNPFTSVFVGQGFANNAISSVFPRVGSTGSNFQGFDASGNPVGFGGF